MTGAILARRLLLREVIADVAVRKGEASCYAPRKRAVFLAARCYAGASARDLTEAAHEIGHALQGRQWGGWLTVWRVTMPGRLWLEWDASRWARALMDREGLVVDEGVLRESWRSYVWPAVGQGVVFAVLGVWFVVRSS